MNNLTIGLIGAGLMGHGIATNIQKKGWDIGILEHPGNQPLGDLIEKGAATYTTPAALTKESDVIILCVTGSPQVEDVLTQENGVISALAPGKIILDCSTAIPSSSVKMAGLVEAAGANFLDTPMTRTPREAAEGRLNLLIGGDEQIFKTVVPLLETFSENISYAGPVGSGHTLKLVHNFVSLAGCAILAEAAANARSAGIDPELLYDVLHNGGGKGAALERMKPYLLSKDTSSFQFSLSNCNKDAGYFLEMSKDLQNPATLATAVSKIFGEATDAGHGDRFVPELIDLL